MTLLPRSADVAAAGDVAGGMPVEKGLVCAGTEADEEDAVDEPEAGAAAVAVVPEVDFAGS